MNLELLDPFGRQIPDRIDATIQLPEALHPAAARDPDDDEWKAAYHVAYNRRGTYIAVGYGSGVTAVFSTLNRTLVALYPHHSPNGCSALSWTRRSRSLLAGAAGDFTLRLYDTTHPYGPEEASFGLLANVAASNSNNKLSASTSASRGGSISHINTNMEDEDENNMEDLVASSDMAPPPPPPPPARGKGKGSRSKNKALDTSSTQSTNSSKPPKQPKQAKVKQQRQQEQQHTTTNRPAKPPPTTATQTTYKLNEIPPDHELALTDHLPFRNVDDPRVRYVKDVRALPMHVVQPGDVVAPQPPIGFVPQQQLEQQQQRHPPQQRYPGVEVTLPSQTSGSVVQIHPRRSNGALAVLSNGALVLVWIPRQSFQGVEKDDDPTRKTHQNNNDDDEDDDEPTGIVYTLYHENNSSGQKNAAVTSAAFDPQGDRVYAALENGRVLGFDVRDLWQRWSEYDGEQQDRTTAHHQQQPLYITAPPPPTFVITNSNGISVWHLVVSRNGKFLIVNAADGAIRVYHTELLWNNNSGNHPNDIDDERRKNPVHVFQDVVTKVKFASTDVSGDGEYVVGGANGADNKYELYIWNTGTGALLDKLTGQSTQLYAVAWHPTRSFLAVACADGIVDIWGPRINWTAFAPDFQALPMNVEYIEREDEFDVDEHGKHVAAAADDDDDFHALGEDGSGGGDYNYYYNNYSRDTKKIDVTTIEPVPVFASDSEDEQEVFFFETKLKNALSGFKTVAKKPRNSEDD